MCERERARVCVSVNARERARERPRVRGGSEPVSSGLASGAQPAALWRPRAGVTRSPGDKDSGPEVLGSESTVCRQAAGPGRAWSREDAERTGPAAPQAWRCTSSTRRVCPGRRRRRGDAEDRGRASGLPVNRLRRPARLLGAPASPPAPGTRADLNRAAGGRSQGRDGGRWEAGDDSEHDAPRSHGLPPPRPLDGAVVPTGVSARWPAARPRHLSRGTGCSRPEPATLTGQLTPRRSRRIPEPPGSRSALRSSRLALLCAPRQAVAVAASPSTGRSRPLARQRRGLTVCRSSRGQSKPLHGGAGGSRCTTRRMAECPQRGSEACTDRPLLCAPSSLRGSCRALTMPPSLHRATHHSVQGRAAISVPGWGGFP